MISLWNYLCKTVLGFSKQMFTVCLFKKILWRLKISFINKCLPFILVNISGEYLLIHSMNMCPLLLMNGYEVDDENSSDLFEDSLAFRK